MELFKTENPLADTKIPKLALRLRGDAVNDDFAILRCVSRDAPGRSSK